MTVGEALAQAGIDAREARLLLAEASGLSEASLIARPERSLASGALERFLALVARRRGGEPVAYILGRREFFGLTLAVSPAALIPRPETELLVELALERLAPQAEARVLDLGTGSGALALAIKHARPRTRVVAVDASLEALALVRANAERLRLEVELRLSCWLDAVAGRFDLVVSNPPYVAQDDPHLREGDLRFEPRAALVAGPDGLEAIRAIVRAAPPRLARGGWLLLEHGLGHDAAVRALLAQAGLEDARTWPDLAGVARVSGASAR